MIWYNWTKYGRGRRPHRRHRWAVGVRKPLKILIMGHSLLDNCYLENKQISLIFCEHRLKFIDNTSYRFYGLDTTGRKFDILIFGFDDIILPKFGTIKSSKSTGSADFGDRNQLNLLIGTLQQLMQKQLII